MYHILQNINQSVCNELVSFAILLLLQTTQCNIFLPLVDLVGHYLRHHAQIDHSSNNIILQKIRGKRLRSKKASNYRPCFLLP